MEEDALILPLAFYRDPKIVMEKTDIYSYATLQSTLLLFFFGIVCIDVTSKCFVFFGVGEVNATLRTCEKLTECL